MISNGVNIYSYISVYLINIIKIYLKNTYNILFIITINKLIEFNIFEKCMKEFRLLKYDNAFRKILSIVNM